MIPNIPKFLLIHSGKILQETKSDPFAPAKVSTYNLSSIRVDMPTKGLTINVDGQMKSFSGMVFYDRTNSGYSKTIASDPNLEIKSGDKFVFNGDEYVVSSVSKVYDIGSDYHHLEILLV